MDIKREFGNRVKTMRRDLELTQENLAEMADISTQSMSQIENGQNFVSAETMDALCKALKVEPKDLFNFEKNEPKEEALIEIVRRLKRNPTLLKTIYKIVIALDI